MIVQTRSASLSTSASLVAAGVSAAPSAGAAGAAGPEGLSTVPVPEPGPAAVARAIGGGRSGRDQLAPAADDHGPLFALPGSTPPATLSTNAELVAALAIRADTDSGAPLVPNGTFPAPGDPANPCREAGKTDGREVTSAPLPFDVPGARCTSRAWVRGTGAALNVRPATWPSLAGRVEVRDAMVEPPLSGSAAPDVARPLATTSGVFAIVARRPLAAGELALASARAGG